MPQKAAWATPKPGRRAAWADIAEEDRRETDDILPFGYFRLLL